MDTNDDPRSSDPLAAMRDLDPAADSAPSSGLRARVSSVPDAVTPAARRRRWLMPVAAAAALVVGVGGGYVVGSGALTGSTEQIAAPLPVATGSTQDPAPPISLAPGAGGAASADSGGDAGMRLQGAQSAPLSTAETAETADSTVSPWHYSNGRRFHLPVFDETTSTATVYALDGRAQYSAADAERIARTLGLDAAAHQEEPEYGWTVGDPQHGGPVLWMSPTGAGDVSFHTGVADPSSACWTQIAPEYGVDTTKGVNLDEATWRAFDADVRACVVATPMPTDQQARDALSLFLTATGVDESQTQVTVTSDDDSRTMTATAARVVAGNVTVVTSAVHVSAKGLLHGNGGTATVVSLGDYDIVSPAEAARRLNDPVFTPAYAASTASEIDYDQLHEPVAEPPAVPVAGARVPWGITEFEIASARLGLAQMTGVEDQRFLAPAYEFTDSEGNVWSVLAIAETEIDPTGGGASAWGGWPWGGWRY